jgi:hypothetical protein
MDATFSAGAGFAAWLVADWASTDSEGDGAAGEARAEAGAVTDFPEDAGAAATSAFIALVGARKG